MNLHNDKKLFSKTMRSASQHLDIKFEFIEKDYWITMILSHLAKSKYFSASVFKGGTSLSKAYNLIERFSEDVDIAIINDGEQSGNKVKSIIRTIEKEITHGLSEITMDGVTSKGSRFRKSVFQYEDVEKGAIRNNIIVEVNSFANPYPFQLIAISSFVFDFLKQTGNEKYIEEYELQPFEINVLSKEQTLLEKMVSLIRFSFHENHVAQISSKIRHFYDLYFLANHPNCAIFIASDTFKNQFETVLNHDKEMFDEPKGWQNKTLDESPFMIDFPSMWKQLKGQYQTELSALAYRTIPDEGSVAKSFCDLIKRIE